MKNLLSATEFYFEFVLKNEEYRTSEGFVSCLSDAVVNFWRMLLFVVEEADDLDDAAQAEESLIHGIVTDFSPEEKRALQQAAQKQLNDRFSAHRIDPEDESQNREQRFLTFIAAGRFDDMYLL